MTIIENDFFRVHFDARKGGSIVAAFARHRGNTLAIMPDSREPHCDLPASCWIMAPYSNRIENGRFQFGDHSYALRRGEEHSIHGDVWQRPWRITGQTATHLRLSFDSRDFDDFNWPWDFTLDADYELFENRFLSRLSLTNVAASAMPAGLGWHPYFNRRLTEADCELRLQARVDSVYPDAHDNRIPSGPVRPLDHREDFSVERAVPEDELIDACFYGYRGGAGLHWPGTGLRLLFESSDLCKHLVLYTPPGKPWIALEPVSNANNGVNLLAAGDRTSGMVALPPGDSLTATLVMAAHWS